MKIVITGASGLIGRNLIRSLLNEGHEVYALVRNPQKITELDSQNIFKWTHGEVPPQKALWGMDAIINLVGEGIADQSWTEERKIQLTESRCLGTRNLIAGISQIEISARPKILISTSAVGYYGDSGEVELTENSPAGKGFLAELCQTWEQEAQAAATLGIRVVIMRLGVVLAKEGGFLSKMVPVVLGRGQQWISWIHIQDVIQFLKLALINNTFQGPYNLVSPQSVRNKEMTQMFSVRKHFPFTVPAPAFLLKMALGEMATALLSSQRAFPQRLVQSGFTFLMPKLDLAFDDIYGNFS